MVSSHQSPVWAFSYDMRSTNGSGTEILSRVLRILLSISPVEFPWRTNFGLAMSTTPLAKAKRNALQPNALECEHLKPSAYTHERASDARPNSRTRTQTQTQLITSYWRKRNTNITISLDAEESNGRTLFWYQCWWSHNSHSGGRAWCGGSHWTNCRMVPMLVKLQYLRVRVRGKALDECSHGTNAGEATTLTVGHGLMRGKAWDLSRRRLSGLRDCREDYVLIRTRDWHEIEEREFGTQFAFFEVHVVS